MRKLFITFEGIEGCGKTTQSRLLAKEFESRGIPYILTREPGGTNSADKIRELLLDKDNILSAQAELLLFYAARVEHVQAVIKPALASGTVVICDRFVDSTMAYQAYARGLGLAYVQQLHNLVMGNFMPDKTFLLDLPVEKAMERLNQRGGYNDRIEREPIEFHENVRRGFLEIAVNNPARFTSIDACVMPQEISAIVIEEIFR